MNNRNSSTAEAEEIGSKATKVTFGIPRYPIAVTGCLEHASHVYKMDGPFKNQTLCNFIFRNVVARPSSTFITESRDEMSLRFFPGM